MFSVIVWAGLTESIFFFSSVNPKINQLMYLINKLKFANFLYVLNCIYIWPLNKLALKMSLSLKAKLSLIRVGPSGAVSSFHYLNKLEFSYRGVTASI